ncbi:hypothetical protein [Parafrankia sp. EUN1f]|uniref:hypothetical protein n=1 Tax=Parafrankia sp. EUN1f TaxID=102897 RepID=UPI0001C45584|nr:hypothetical protein [Parafrankia sp. EUN1f]EFC86475.1 hypothetical protein FrEUN1fDRAFT_0370 [Parafrankia sp. EUN1f]
MLRSLYDYALDYVRREPVRVSVAVGAAVTWVSGFLISHGIAVSDSLLAAVGGVVVFVLGELARTKVSPFSKDGDSDG